MTSSVKVLEPAFQGAGQRVGIEIWRVENFQPVPLPKSDYGKFYSGDSYIILQTTSGKGGSYLFDIHFWLGKDTSQDEAGTAAIKTVELDTMLGGRAVQHREIQGHESDKFLSYFKPCIIPLEGGVASGFKTPEEEEFEARLYLCKGKRVVRMKQVPFSRSSLNHDDIFILDTKDKIYQFNGVNSNIQERAKALEVVQFLKDTHHSGMCMVAIVEDGNQAEPDSGEFWELFGGFAPICRKIAGEDDIILEKTPPKLFCIADGQLSLVDGDLSKSILESTKCYLLDCGIEIFVWVGRVTQLDERKAATQIAEAFFVSQNRPKSTKITRLIQGHETHSFKLEFDSWSSGSTSAPEEGRGKVAAFLKQQGGGIKASIKSAPAKEEAPLLDGGGKLEVWCINENAMTPVPKEDVGKFYSGDCYVVLYSYHSHHDKKEDYYLCWWIGKNSIEEDRMMAAELVTKMFNSLKGRPVMGRIFQGKEPPQFVAIFQPMVVLKGGLSSGYKNFIVDKDVNDETYTADSVALVQISGTSVHNNKAVQVDLAATSLNSNECFLLQSGSMFIWHGVHSTYEQQQLAAKIADFLKPGVSAKHTKEGAEISAFWSALGGKENYTSKKAPLEVMVRDPHMFTYSINKGKFEVKEVYNFSQDDLLTEDVLILDTHAEVFIWVGQLTDLIEKQTAFEVGQKYIEMASSLEGLSPSVPLYKVTEGNEPCFFTAFFSWDPAKAITHGNSFQKKVMLLLGASHAAGERSDHDGPTQRASALAALNSAFNSSSSSPSKPSSPRPVRVTQGSQRAAAIAALSTVLTAENKQISIKSPSAESSPTAGTENEKASADIQDSEVKEPDADESTVETNEEDEDEIRPDEEQDGNDSESNLPIFSYEQLKVKSENPITEIDFKRREAYLSDEEFEAILEMPKEAFYKLPKWKQDQLKKKVDLF